MTLATGLKKFLSKKIQQINEPVMNRVMNRFVVNLNTMAWLVNYFNTIRTCHKQFKAFLVEGQ